MQFQCLQNRMQCNCNVAVLRSAFLGKSPKCESDLNMAQFSTFSRSVCTHTHKTHVYMRNWYICVRCKIIAFYIQFRCTQQLWRSIFFNICFYFSVCSFIRFHPLFGIGSSCRVYVNAYPCTVWSWCAMSYRSGEHRSNTV